MFSNRKLVIATKHKKEQVIAPILERELGVFCFVPKDFDSDAFGTFSGEVERKLDPIETARRKCLAAMEDTGCDLGIASEGSFGTHPAMFFVAADDEFLVFIDKKNDLEIIARELTTETNFQGTTIRSEEELLKFAEGAQFPSHGLILRKSAKENEDLFKGISQEDELKRIGSYLLKKYGFFHAETDMRAMYNPTRMEAIRLATEKLVEKIQSTCSSCGTPGFSVVDVKKGLPCSTCGCPTESILSYLHQCQKCGFSEEEMYPKGKLTEDPMYCHFCNP